MITPTRIAKLLVDRVTEHEESRRRQSRINPREEEIIGSLLEVIHNVCNCTSYEIRSDVTLDHENYEEFDGFQDVSAGSEDEDVDPSFGETAEGEKRSVQANFSLDYMKKVVEYYDARDSNGRRKHTWKSTQHRFKSVPHRQYMARFRHYIDQHGTKKEKIQIVDDFVYEKFEG